MTGPTPAVAAAREGVRRSLADLAAGSVVLVACSGGPDSLALAAATAVVAPRLGLRAGALVVDHGLQGASDVVAEEAGRQCRALGLDPVDVVRVEVPEAAAREARHAAFAEAAARRAARAVLLGHTLDDQAETVLLGLARGSGSRSLSGMAARRGVLRRPLLHLRRSDTEQVCADLGLTPWQDPTNEDGPLRSPLRSRVRHRVLPVLEAELGPGVARALARTADQLREDADALDGFATEVLAEARRPDGTLDVHVLGAAVPAVRRRALRFALVAAGCPSGSLQRVHVEAVDALLTAWRGQGPVHLPGGREASRTCGTLVVL